jgi:hypothetical protein
MRRVLIHCIPAWRAGLSPGRTAASLAESGGAETAGKVINLLDLNLDRRLGAGVRWRGAVGNTHDRACCIVAASYD